MIILLLAKVPALLCRLGHVPYNRTFGALRSGCAPYGRSHSALLIRGKKV